MIEQLRNKVKELLRAKQVDAVIGYKRAADGVSAVPAFITTEQEANLLIWDYYCIFNLAVYLKDFSGKKIGIIAKGCDAKSIIVLLTENQLKREDVFIIGVECPGVIDEKIPGFTEKAASEIGFDKKCKKCKPATPPLYDFLITMDDKNNPPPKSEEDPYETVRKLEAKSADEKFKFWHKEFSRCIRCYACRQICPLCYCPRCVADQTQPPWFSKAALFEGNFTWNVIRAMHLGGRCIDCGECERVCPVRIPLREINKKIEKDIKELFSYEAGKTLDQKPFFASFDKDDPEDFIK